MNTLTMMEFEGDDMAQAYRISDRLGYHGNCAYTSTSGLIGLFCLKFSPNDPAHLPQTDGCVIKTKELGFMFVQDVEDLGWSLDEFYKN